MKDLFDLKHLVHAQCVALLAERIRNAEAGVEEAMEAGRSDTKSSAGDKHETGRAMAQLESEKQQAALGNLRDLARTLHGIDPDRRCIRIERGALIQMEQGLFYVATALGKVQAERYDVMVISPESPLVTALAPMKVGEVREFKGIRYWLTGIS
mgnify:CR=1 FL=1